MNRLADELGFLILYPQQSKDANLARCWNWHNPAHQGRSGEPAVIAALTRHAIMLGRVNPARVYIVGLSAGGAAAAIVGAAYTGIFTAVGVHSGILHGNVPVNEHSIVCHAWRCAASPGREAAASSA